jgi:hypothetical protein
MQQLAYVRPIVFTEGRASYLRGYAIKNGTLNLNVLTDKCLDIADFSYKGININFLSKPGLTGRNHYDTHGLEAQRSIMGGLFFTCGLGNTCPPCEVEGKEYPMHGRMRSTPAEHIYADAFWENDEYIIKVGGEMREAELFGENMVLRRFIQTKYGTNTILIHDEIENLSFREEAMMLMYHFNIGYPILSPGSRVILPSTSVVAHGKYSQENIKNWFNMDDPIPNAPEQVFVHQIAADFQGNTFAAVINEKERIGVQIKFNQKYLPNFIQWKSIGAGDYVMGLEPSNSVLFGREYHQSNQILHMLNPFGKEIIELEISILDGEREISEIKKLASKLSEKK